MKTYFDSSALVKLYTAESGIDQVLGELHKGKPPLMINSLHVLEIQNTFRLKKFRKEWDLKQLKLALSAFRSDLNSGVLRIDRLDWSKVFHGAEVISAAWAAKKGLRSLDILHLSAARNNGATRFVTFDLRQKAVARSLKMRVGV